MPAQRKRPAPTLTPIAIVGMSCRLPGANGVDQLWSLLTEGAETTSEMPPSRFDMDTWWDPQPATPGRTASRRGGFLDGADGFDAGFFGITPREALRMDPQQRLLLEVAWEALEDAAIPPDQLPSDRTGVFTGVFASGYWDRLRQPELLDVYALTGTTRGGLSGRLSHAFDLRGPSLTLDTACSSGLVALHLACQSLRSGESTVALVGATNLVLSPEESVAFSQAKMLSPDGRCKFGSAHADGYVRSEGVIALVLKPLADAQRDGDPIQAVIHGSAVSSDGRSGGSMPSPGKAGQIGTLRAAYAGTGIPPAQVGYVEAHGTGTAAGDPVEVAALGTVFGEGRAADRPLLVGSIKTNIGHTEAAAGLAGLVKTVLCLRHRRLPASLHAGELNPAIDWAGLNVRVQTELTDWPSDADVLYAGVNAFGISGTNAHAVLGSAPPRTAPAEADPVARQDLLPLSARSPVALRDLAARYADLLDQDQTLPVADLCHSAATGRVHHEYRLAVTGTDVPALRTGLRAFLADEPAPGLRSGEWHGRGRPKVVFVFPGQGSQWIGMGRELLRDCPVFAAALTECSDAVLAEAGWSVLDTLAGEDLDTAGIDVVQPALWAIEVALAAQWRAWGVLPDVVLGHSMGEIAAACVAGALTVPEAAAVICRRSKLLTRVAGRGAMASVELSVAGAEAAIGERTDRVSVAVSNGPNSTVLAGDPGTLREILAELAEREVFTKPVKVDVASHSPQMDELRTGLLEALHMVRPAQGSVPLFSTVRGAVVAGTELDPGYWAANLRQPVRFADAATALLAEGPTVFVECSPHPILVGALDECTAAAGGSGVAVGSTRRGEPELAAMLDAVATLYCSGCPLDWPALAAAGARRISVSGYPWQHERFWLEAPAQGGTTPSRHPLLGTPVAAGPRVHRYEGRIDPAALGYLTAHQVEGVAVLPATGYLEMVHAAAVAALGIAPVLTGVTFRRAVYLDGANPLIRTELRRTGDGWAFEVSSSTGADEGWVTNATGKVSGADVDPIAMPPVEEVWARCTRRWDGAEFYARFDEVGNQWRESFRGIESLCIGAGETLSTIKVPEELVATLDRYYFHPAVLDAAAQLSAVVSRSLDDLAPFFAGGVDRVRLLGRPASAMRAYARRGEPDSDGTVPVDIVVATEEGTPVAELAGLRLRYLDTLTSLAPVPTGTEPGGVYELDWRAVRDERPGPASAGHWLIFDDGTDVVEALAGALPGSSRIIGGRGRAHPREHLAEAIAANPGNPLGVVHLAHAQAELPDAVAVTEVAALAEALANLPGSPPVRLWLVTRGALSVAGTDHSVHIGHSAVWGLGRGLAAEHRDWHTCLIDLATTGDQVPALLAELTGSGAEPQVALRGRQRYVPRLSPLRLPAPAPRDATAGTDQVLRLEALGTGAPTDVELRAEPARPPEPHEVQIAVSHSAINFKDVLIAIDPSNLDIPTATGYLGCDCAGTISAVGTSVAGLRIGEEVVAHIPHGGMASRVTLDAHLVQPLPAGMTAAEAVTLPTGMLTAYYALREVAKLRQGERVLIHAATGGTGLAAIQVASWIGAEIYATAGNPSKRALLRLLGVRHVFDSRSTEFGAQIRELTRGEGVDVILNTLSGDAISANVAALADFGRYVDLTKHLVEGKQAGFADLPRNASFTTEDICQISEARPRLAGTLLREIFQLVRAGVFTPLPYQVFDVADAGTAFGMVARAEHTGKVVLSFAGSPSVPSAAGSGSLPADASYLVTGGLGGLGLEVGRWLIGRGARHLSLLGRTPLPPRQAWPDAQGLDRDRIEAIGELERLGAVVRYVAVDVADAASVRAALHQLRADGAPPIRGVLHAAGVIEVRPAEELTEESVLSALAPKLAGGWALHNALADTTLDFFVLFSSGSAVIGSPMLGAYAAANAALDGLAWHRRSAGLPALTVNWGFWSQVGMAARFEQQRGRSMAPEGAISFTPAQGLAILEALLDADATQATVFPADWNRWAATHPDASADPVLRDVLPTSAAPPVTPPSTAETKTETRAKTKIEPKAEPATEATAGPEQPKDIEGFLISRVARAMGLTPSQVDRHRPLNAQGLDSLMATEVRTQLLKTLGVLIPITKMLGGMSLAELAAEAQSPNGTQHHQTI